MQTPPEFAHEEPDADHHRHSEERAEDLQGDE